MARLNPESEVQIPVGNVIIEGMLEIPLGAPGVVLFAHGSGSSRHSPRNNFVAKELRKEKLGTLLLDLLALEEDAVYETRFDIDLLTQRLAGATRWLMGQKGKEKQSIGYFGASTGAAAALQAAVKLGPVIRALVSRGGRPDMAEQDLPRVKAPTLLIVGGDDLQVLSLNQSAYDRMKSEKKLVIIPGATHLFEEPGALEKVAELAAQWFKKYLSPSRPF